MGGGAGAGLAFVVVAVLAFTPASASAAGVVHCATQDLQARLNTAPPGSTVLVDGTCDGLFIVPNDITMRGNPTATLDGGQAGTTIAVNAAHMVHLEHLTITGGWSTNGVGGGVSVAGGKLFLDHDVITGNVSTVAAGTSQACGAASGRSEARRCT